MHDPNVIRRRRAVLALLVLGSIVLLTASFGGSGGVGSVQRGVAEVVAPLQDGASRALKPARDLVGWFGDTWDAKSDNRKLRKELAASQTLAAANTAGASRTREAEKLLGIDRALSADQMGPVGARISALAPTVFSQSIQINKGTGAGIRKDDPVIGSGGLIGKVDEVGRNFARVQLITDRDWGTGAAVAQGGSKGTIKAATGGTRELLLTALGSTGRVRAGDLIVTRGTATSRFPSAYPPDVPIGKVTKVDDSGSDAQQAHVAPTQDVRDLTYVTVLTEVPRA